MLTIVHIQVVGVSVRLLAEAAATAAERAAPFTAEPYSHMDIPP